MTDKNVARLASLFEGFAGAHGTHGTPTREPGSLKWAIKSTAKTLREAVTMDLWEQHVAGKRPLGIIPIREDNTCSWGSIDFDEYDVDLAALIARVEASKLPLVPCRSKSGGLHLFLFVSRPEPASQVQAVLRDMAASLGMGECEIFPKQTKLLADRGDFGNWMVMPYFGGDYGGKLRMQHGLKKNGSEMILSEFLKAADGKRADLAKLEETTVKRRDGTTTTSGKNRKRASGGGKGDFSDGPPCLQHLAAAGVQTDGRKRTLFMQALYYKRACPDDWKERLEKSNQQFSPPLPAAEVLGVVRSLEKKDYEYTCKEEPMRSHCNSVLCRMRKFGVGNGGEYPAISSMRKLDSRPPVWFVEVEGCVLELSTDDLQNYSRFQRACMEQVNIFFMPVKVAAWAGILSDALKGMEILEPTPDHGEASEFFELLEDFLTNKSKGRRKEDLFSEKPWENADEGRHYFTLKALQNYLKRSGMKEGAGRAKVISQIRALDGGHDFFNFGNNRGLNVWWIPSERVKAIGEISPPPLEGEKI